MDTKSRVQNIFRDVFDDDKLTITNEMSAPDIEDWDSLANVDLVVAMENEFNVKFNMQEIQSLKNVGDMINLVDRLITK